MVDKLQLVNMDPTYFYIIRVMTFCSELNLTWMNSLWNSIAMGGVYDAEKAPMKNNPTTQLQPYVLKVSTQ